MRKPLIALLVAGLAGAMATEASAATRTVRVGDDFFRPRSLSVSAGTVVRWRFTGRDQHNVVSSGAASFQSPLKRSGTFRRKLNRRGTYRIVCSIHQPDMRMTIRVR
jgi:plastocyanin